ncbi:DUF4352 domain-containing protein [Thalassobacillus hwangdonensis]|uniref:DUF4352 domain-containing protein n=1 Tax=Thalassobacillus hwangdonensis TaxID=546108 RepID=A0ABW3KX65_9BACI
MKGIMKLTLFIIIILIVTGCSSNDEQTNETNKANEEDVTQSNQDTSEEDETELEQTTLNMGETAELSTTVGDFSLTLTNAQEKTEIDGEQSQREIFVVTEWEVKNTSEEPIEISETIGAIKLFNDIRISGAAWILLEDDEEWSGELKPGESETGELLFEIEDTENYSVGMNYASSESAPRKVMWNFTVE